MTRSWYIDAYDPLAGYAFASFREATLMSVARLAETSTIFMAPPHFRPEPIANATIAAAAARRSFQEGLYLENGEVPFSSPDDVARFVRRVYVSSGGRDGGGGGGEALGPTPTPDTGSPADSPTSRAFLTEVRAFAHAVKSQDRLGESTQLTWTFAFEPVARGGARDLAYRALIEQATRTSLNSTHPSFLQQSQTWLTCALAIGMTPDDLERELSRVTLSDPHREHLLREFFRDYPYYWRYFGPHRLPPYVDPIDALSNLLVGADSIADAGLDPRITSIWQLVNRSIACPRLLLPLADAEYLVGLLVLASVMIVASDHHVSAETGTFDWWNSLGARALVWLQEQLPTQAYPEVVERLIESVDVVRRPAHSTGG